MVEYQADLPAGLTPAAIYGLLKRIEKAGYTDRQGRHRTLVPSSPRGSLLALARRLSARREQFAPGVVLSDLEAALSDPDFDGLRGKSLGLLLSHGFICRYVSAVNRRAVLRSSIPDAGTRAVGE
jgi:hypothetical protein